MGQIELTCPGCAKRLRMSDAHQGKTVRCPSCKATFPALIERPPETNQVAPSPEVRSRSTVRIVGRPAPAADSRETTSSAERKLPEKPSQPMLTRPSRVTRKPVRPARDESETWLDETDDLSSNDDAEAEDYDDPYSGSRPATARSRRKKSELPGKLLKAGLVLLLILIGLGSVGGIGYFAWSHLPRISGNVVDMTWFPENVQGVAYIELSSILASPIMQAIESKSSPFPEEGPLGLKNSDIQSMVIGFWKDAGAGNEIPAAALLTSPWGLPSGGQGVMIVARLNRSVTLSEIRMQPQSEYKGMQLYGAGSNGVCWMPDPATVVVGDEQKVREAIDRGNQEFRFQQFDFARSSGDLVFAAIGEASSLAGSPLSTSSTGAAQQLNNLVSQNTRGGSVSLWFSDRIQIQAQVLCRDESGASQIVKELNDTLSLGKSQIESLKVNPAFQTFAGPLTETLNSITTSHSGSSVTINAEIRQSLIDQLPSGGF